MELHFLHAEYLLGLLVVLGLIGASLWLNVKARLAARRVYGEGRLVDRYTRKPESWGAILKSTAWLVIAALLVVAAAGPYRPEAPDQVKAGTLQVVIVMDVSRSMAAEDYRDSMPDDGTKTEIVGPYGSRLDMTRYMIGQIMQSVQGNQVGIVTYSGEGFPQADLTTDFTALRFVVKNWIKIGGAPGGGSDYARGLAQALETFKRDADSGKQRVIVLFSDGGFTGDQAELAKVVDEMRAAGVRLVILGLGSTSPVPIPVYERDQLKGYFQKDGQVVTTSINEGPLTQLAAASGGEYHHIAAGQELPRLEWSSTLGGTRVEPRVEHLYQWVLGLALSLLFVLSLSGLSRSRRDVL